MKKTRNYLLGYVKLILSCLPVFIHYPLQNNAGYFLGCLCRLTVPFFFMISGYYCYLKKSDAIATNIKRISHKFLFSFLLYLVWGMIKQKVFYQESVLSYLSSVFSIKNISQKSIIRTNYNCRNR